MSLPPPISRPNTRHGVNMDKPWHGLHWQLVHALLDPTVHNIGQDYNWCIKQPQSSLLSPLYVDWTFNSEVELDNIKGVDPVPGQIWGLWAGDLLPRCHWIFFWTDASLVLWKCEVNTVFGFSELYKKPNVTALRVTIVQSLVLTGIIEFNEEPRDCSSVQTFLLTLITGNLHFILATTRSVCPLQMLTVTRHRRQEANSQIWKFEFTTYGSDCL